MEFKKKFKKMLDVVIEILTKDEISRSNDTRLCRLVYEELGLPTNLLDLEFTKAPSLASIVRLRRIAQLRNPFLASQKNIRKNLEVEYKKALKEI